LLLRHATVRQLKSNARKITGCICCSNSHTGIICCKYMPFYGMRNAECGIFSSFRILCIIPNNAAKKLRECANSAFRIPHSVFRIPPILLRFSPLPHPLRCAVRPCTRRPA
jgi:hypothetical protein